MEVIFFFIVVAVVLAIFLLSNRLNLKSPPALIPIGYTLLLILFLLVLFKTNWIIDGTPETQKQGSGYSFSILIEAIADFFERVQCLIIFLATTTVIALIALFGARRNYTEIRKGLLRVVLINLVIFACGALFWVLADYL